VTNKKLLISIAVAILIGLGVFLHFYHIEFGLPHSFYADEPEFSEPAIKYTYEIRNSIKNNDYHKLVPISYVYGTFPVYFLTGSLMGFSKAVNVLNIYFDKTTLFIFLRVVTAVVSVAVAFGTWLLAKKLSFLPTPSLIAALLVLFNWKLIVHAHYVNADIFLTLLLLCSFYYFAKYENTPDNRNLFISALFFGLAAGTKITTLISLPIYLYVIAKKKDLYGIPGFIISFLIFFIASNPFSLVFFNDFSFRIYEMLFKEGGMILDSVDTNPFKYVLALTSMLTLPIFAVSLYGIWAKIRKAKKPSETNLAVFLTGNVAIYLVFFSLQSRRVDRWLLPILPVLLIYAAYGTELLLAKFKGNFSKIVFLVLLVSFNVFNLFILTKQFQRWTPKSEAYLWAKTNLPPLSTKLAYTEEGLDPLNKLDMAKVIQYKVYISENAQLFYPENARLYDYIIISTRPMENFKKPEVQKRYPMYAQQWTEFEETLQDPQRFQLMKEFTLPKPNLIPLSDVYIYKKL